MIVTFWEYKSQHGMESFDVEPFLTNVWATKLYHMAKLQQSTLFLRLDKNYLNLQGKARNYESDGSHQKVDSCVLSTYTTHSHIHTHTIDKYINVFFTNEGAAVHIDVKTSAKHFLYVVMDLCAVAMTRERVTFNFLTADISPAYYWPQKVTFPIFSQNILAKVHITIPRLGYDR